MDIQVESINHLGLIAGIIDSIGLVDLINNEIETDSREKITGGQVVKAVILNGLGFVSRPLYLFPQFFDDKAIEHLLGEGIKPSYLNQDKIGRVMDKLYNLGLSKTFLSIALAAFKKYQVNTDYSHLDSSSFSVHGEYDYNLPTINDKNIYTLHESENEKEIPITITYGYSRNKRPDLKQFILNMIVSGDGDVPIFMETADGNQSDKNVFGKIAKKYKKQVNLDTIIVADSALYSQKNIELMNSISWITRVPLSVGEAQDRVNNLAVEEFKKAKIKGYLFKEIKSNYGGIEQRWLVIESEARKKSDHKKLAKKIEKESLDISKKITQLSNKEFESEIEANFKLKEISSKLKYHLNLNQKVIEKVNKKGKTFYNLTTECKKNKTEIKKLENKTGRFILATNKLDSVSLTNDEILQKDKEQQTSERGFAFLKDPLFFADSVFLKTPQRVETMAMLMGLCLLIYTLGQREIRLQLLKADTGIKNQLKKPTNRPTLRWIFQCFQGIHVIFVDGVKQIVNLTENRLFTLSFFPKLCQKYYILSG